MIWLVVALIMWPIVSLVVGLLLGRVLASCSAHPPQPMPGLWARPTLPDTVVAPTPPGRDVLRRFS